MLPMPNAGAGSALWLHSSGDGDVVSRTGTLSMLRRFTEKVYANTKDVTLKGPVAVSISRTGARQSFNLDGLQKLAAAVSVARDATEGCAAALLGVAEAITPVAGTHLPGPAAELLSSATAFADDVVPSVVRVHGNAPGGACAQGMGTAHAYTNVSAYDAACAAGPSQRASRVAS